MDVLARGRRGESLEVGGPGRVPHEREDRAVWPRRKLLDEAQLLGRHMQPCDRAGGRGGGERVSVSGFEDYGDREEEARTPMPRDAPVTAYEGIMCGLCRGLCAESSAVSCTTGQYRTLLLYLGVECRCTQY